MKTIYSADSWLFVKSINIVIDDVQIPSKNMEFKREHHDGIIWEINDMLIENEAMGLIDAISKSKKTVVRFYGDNYKHDHIVTQKEKQSMKDTIEAFNALDK
jgi:hypothetical protein